MTYVSYHIFLLVLFVRKIVVGLFTQSQPLDLLLYFEYLHFSSCNLLKILMYFVFLLLSVSYLIWKEVRQKCMCVYICRCTYTCLLQKRLKLIFIWTFDTKVCFDVRNFLNLTSTFFPFTHFLHMLSNIFPGTQYVGFLGEEDAMKNEWNCHQWVYVLFGDMDSWKEN